MKFLLKARLQLDFFLLAAPATCAASPQFSHNISYVCYVEQKNHPPKLKMKLAVVSSVLATAAAFAPAANKPITTSLNAAFENELGVQEPLGFWDPLGK